MPSHTIAMESPDQPAVIALIAELDAYQRSLYPPESCHMLDIQALAQPNVVFAVVRDTAARAVGCGAVVLQDGYGELKRMFVHPDARGQGLASNVLAFLEQHARAARCAELRLETGPRQHAALALYARHGYTRCSKFGSYTDDPLSVFMRKPLIGTPVPEPDVLNPSTA